jgi:hypothetical protein
MLAISGTYLNGYVTLDTAVSSEKPVRVIIKFLDDMETDSPERLFLSDFSFAESRKATEGYKGSFSDELIEERRSEQ